MAQTEHLLAGVAQGPMAHVVEQGRGVKQASVLGQFRMTPFQMAEGEAGQVQHPQRMGEAARFGAMEGEKRRSQLTDPSQSLKRDRVDQIDRQGLRRGGAIQPDRSMQRIVISALAHAGP